MHVNSLQFNAAKRKAPTKPPAPEKDLIDLQEPANDNDGGIDLKSSTGSKKFSTCKINTK